MTINLFSWFELVEYNHRQEFRIDMRSERCGLRTADVSPRSSPLRDVSRGWTSATQRQKFLTDDVNQCFLVNKSGSDGVPNTIFFLFYVSPGRFWKSVVFICKWAPTKLKCFFYRRLYSRNIDCFVTDSSRLHLTFAVFCLLSVIRKQ